MNDKERVQLIRQGNEHFNDGNIELAKKYYLKADYKDGLLRVANYYFYEQKQPLLALPFYMKCSAKEKVDEIFQRMAFALGKMISTDGQAESSGENRELKSEPIVLDDES